jgi:hypothetical protein
MCYAYSVRWHRKKSIVYLLNRNVNYLIIVYSFSYLDYCGFAC